MTGVRYFGEAWPSGVCDDGIRVRAPIGKLCFSCGESIRLGDQGWYLASGEPRHRECALRDTLGGIGHHEDHARWCVQGHDPDGGRSRRQSALEVWELHVRGAVPT
jgi:hypothetical protein